MKITRLKRGHRIHMGDREYHALTSLVAMGEAYLEGMGRAERLETERELGFGTLEKVRASWAFVEDRR